MRIVKTFRHRCVKCGNCCKTNGRVYLMVEDVLTLSENMKMSVILFLDQYCEYRVERYILPNKGIVQEKLALRKLSDNKCIFLMGNLCRIHSVKPLQCKAAPCLPQFLDDEEAWLRFAAICKGFGSGEEYKPNRYIRLSDEVRNQQANYVNLLAKHNGSLKQLFGYNPRTVVECVVDMQDMQWNSSRT